MEKIWHDSAWNDYVSWQEQDRKTLKKINKLIKSIERDGYNCIGKPESLKDDLRGMWSVRINDRDRLVFKIANCKLEIKECKTHYGDK